MLFERLPIGYVHVLSLANQIHALSPIREAMKGGDGGEAALASLHCPICVIYSVVRL